jgi:branched-chain amino acid aminotransferase
MPIASTPKVWMNGELVDWERAQVHVLTHTLHYGTGVFEGMRAYPTSNGPAIFRLTEHIERLHRSAHILMMPLDWSVADLVQASKDTVNSTGLDACYVRPLVYFGYGEMGLNTLPCTVDVAIACWPWAALHGAEVLQRGVRLKVSSWRRHDHNTMPPAAKTVGNYVNSSLAQTEAIRAGYDGTIILNPQGLVSECAGENIFVVRNGTVYTPPLSAGALEGLTQASVRTILADLGIPLVVTDLARTELYIADEMFTCGTAAEVGSVRSVDDREIACPGPITTAVAEIYSRATRGEDPRYLHWAETCR